MSQRRNVLSWVSPMRPRALKRSRTLSVDEATLRDSPRGSELGVSLETAFRKAWRIRRTKNDLWPPLPHSQKALVLKPGIVESVDPSLHILFPQPQHEPKKPGVEKSPTNTMFRYRVSSPTRSWGSRSRSNQAKLTPPTIDPIGTVSRFRNAGECMRSSCRNSSPTSPVKHRAAGVP